MCDVGTEANSVTRWLVNFFSSIFGHLQQIKIAKQQNLAQRSVTAGAWGARIEGLRMGVKKKKGKRTGRGVEELEGCTV